MKNRNIIVLLIIIIIILIGFIFISNKKNLKDSTGNSSPAPQAIVSNENPKEEVFQKQPGAIKSVKIEGSSEWTLAVDVLSRNTKWKPGVDSTGGFFLNQNPKIRNLKVTSTTKAYACDPTSNPLISKDIATLIGQITDTMNRGKTDSGILGEFGYTAYFDISNSSITAIYEQCLP